MSGGTHNYLCYAEFPEIMDRTTDMVDMEKDLIRLGYPDIAKDVRRLIEYCYSAENAVSVLSENLTDIFHDIEWYYSDDISKESLIKTLDLYREGGGKVKKVVAKNE